MCGCEMILGELRQPPPVASELEGIRAEAEDVALDQAELAECRWSSDLSKEESQTLSREIFITGLIITKSFLSPK